MGIYFNDEFYKRLAEFEATLLKIEEKYKEMYLKKDDGTYYELKKLYHIKPDGKGNMGIGFEQGYLPAFIQSEVTTAFTSHFS